MKKSFKHFFIGLFFLSLIGFIIWGIVELLVRWEENIVKSLIIIALGGFAVRILYHLIRWIRHLGEAIYEKFKD